MAGVGRPDNDDEVLLGVRAELERDPLRQLLRNGVLDVPGLVLGLTVGDGVVGGVDTWGGSDREGQAEIFKFFSDHGLLITQIIRVDGELDDLLAVGKVAHAQGRPQHLARIKRAVVKYVRVHVDHRSDINVAVLLSPTV